MTNIRKDMFQKLCDEYTELANIVEAAEYACTTGKDNLIDSLNIIKPSKKMLEEQGYSSLEEFIQEIEENLCIC